MSIKQLIKESGLRQNYIAECLGISEQTLCNKVNGRRGFTEQELEGLAKTLEMPLRMVERAASLVRR